MIYQIEINDDLVSTLDRLAADQNITSEECAKRNLEAYLTSQFRADIVRKVENKQPKDLATIDAAVKKIEDDIKVAEVDAAVDAIVAP